MTPFRYLAKKLKIDKLETYLNGMTIEVENGKYKSIENSNIILFTFGYCKIN